jgi:class 3 adenylate cyclase
MFADLCGYTAYTCRHGDTAAADLAVAFHRSVRELAADGGCDVVKLLGDGVMLHARDCQAAVRLAHRILDLSAGHGYPPIRIGLDSGPAVHREGDWYGATVNAAARLAAAATPGELLVSDRARRTMPETASVRLIARGVRRLKGMPELAVHSVVAA